MADVNNGDTFLLIAGQYQGGSTLLMRLINKFPDVKIQGENTNAFYELTKFYECIKYANINRNSQEFYDYKTVKPAWYNIFDFKRFYDDIRTLCFNIYKTSDEFKIYGFKEIRCGEFMTYDSMNKSLTSLKEMFPELKIIFLTRERDFKNVKDINYMINDRRSCFDEYYNQINSFEVYSYKNKDYCYILDYKDIITVNDKVRDMFKFLNINFNENLYREELNIKL